MCASQDQVDIDDDSAIVYATGIVEHNWVGLRQPTIVFFP